MRRVFISLVVILLMYMLSGCQKQTEPQLVTTRLVSMTQATPTSGTEVENLFTSVQFESGTFSTDLLSLLVPVEVEEAAMIIGTTFVQTSEVVDISGLVLLDTVPYVDSFSEWPCGNATVTLTNAFYWTPGMYWQDPGYHPGIDLVCDREGTPWAAPVYATAPGIVIKAFTDLLGPTQDSQQDNQESINYWVSGGVVVIVTRLANEKIPSNLLVSAGIDASGQYSYVIHAYGHMNPINVAIGQVVKQGDILGTQGNTGISYGTHVHYGTYLYNQMTGNLFAIHPNVTSQ